MSDQQLPPNNPPGMPGGNAMPPSPVLKNLSMLNPNDAVMMKASGMVTPKTTVREFFEQQGVDVDGPVTQLSDLAKRQIANNDPLTKMKNIAADTALQKGGQPPTMPGVKPMVAPPGQPAPSGMEGLMNRLGG
jgi:hypothetical protein